MSVRQGCNTRPRRLERELGVQDPERVLRSWGFGATPLGDDAMRWPRPRPCPSPGIFEPRPGVRGRSPCGALTVGSVPPRTWPTTVVYVVVSPLIER